MRKQISIVLIICIAQSFSACVNTNFVATKIPSRPVYEVSPKRIVLVSTYDLNTEKYRNKKLQLFNELRDLSLVRMAEDLEKRTATETIVLRGYDAASIQAEEHAALAEVLLKKYKATDAIFLNKLELYFLQTGVEVERDVDGSKNRTAYYDIVSNINYAWYDEQGLFQQDNVQLQRFYQSRWVLSGLLAAGPNVVKKGDDALEYTFENGRRYLNLYFPGYEERQRVFFSSKKIGDIHALVKSGNYELALAESEQYTNAANTEHASLANYNCAVLCEILGRYEQVKTYLNRSLKYSNNLYALDMLNDY